MPVGTDCALDFAAGGNPAADAMRRAAEMEITSAARRDKMVVLRAFHLWNSFPAVLRYQFSNTASAVLTEGGSSMTALLNEYPAHGCC
jgi:hypothetical protein